MHHRSVVARRSLNISHNEVFFLLVFIYTNFASSSISLSVSSEGDRERERAKAHTIPRLVYDEQAA
jgi:hypothetical protein